MGSLSILITKVNLQKIYLDNFNYINKLHDEGNLGVFLQLPLMVKIKYKVLYERWLPTQFKNIYPNEN
jgi:hypothetical protein